MFGRIKPAESNCNGNKHDKRRKRGGDVGKVRDGPNWKKIRAEYIKGGISQRKLAEKYGIPVSTLMRRAQTENWVNSRTDCECKTDAKLVQKIAESESDQLAQMAVDGTSALQKILRLANLDLDELLKSGSTRITRKFNINKQGTPPVKATEEKNLGTTTTAVVSAMRTLGLDAASKLAKEKLKLDSGIDQVTGDDGFLDALDGAQPDAWSIEDEPQNIGDSESGDV